MATGHICRIAPINQDRTSSGVSRLMYTCQNTFIHSGLSSTFDASRRDRPEASPPTSDPEVPYVVNRQLSTSSRPC
jgi:hypothetical protein